MSSVTQNVIKHKVGLLNLAAKLGNVSRACKVKGFSRDTFHRYQSAMACDNDTQGAIDTYWANWVKTCYFKRFCNLTLLRIAQLSKRAGVEFIEQLSQNFLLFFICCLLLGIH